MKGAKPKLELVKETGTGRSRRRAERIAGTGALEPPDHLTPEEKTLWDMAVSSLPTGVLARADTSIMERYVVAWARLRECDRAVKADGLLVNTDAGIRRHPLLTTMTALSKEVHACGAELGMSPVARQRIMAAKTAPDDDMAWLMSPE